MYEEVHQKPPIKENFIAAYMQCVLETETFPNSVYAFCKKHHWEESDFYSCYGSLKALRRDIWKAFFQQTLTRCESASLAETDLRDKTLQFYFTFFELLGLNRSYVLLDLQQDGNPLQRLHRIDCLKSEFQDLARSWMEAFPPSGKEMLHQAKSQVFATGLWGQFLFLLNFWIQDTSADFEKTDIAIEKSVNTIFDLFDAAPIERLIDLGKFLVRERFS